MNENNKDSNETRTQTQGEDGNWIEHHTAFYLFVQRDFRLSFNVIYLESEGKSRGTPLRTRMIIPTAQVFIALTQLFWKEELKKTEQNENVSNNA